MKQVVRQVGSGKLRVADVPAPVLRPGGLLVRNHFSVLSPGTERMKLELGRKSMLGKALSRPEDVKKVLDTARREGLASTYRKVSGRLGELTTLGYSCAGVVQAVGQGVSAFSVGDRVACAGEGYASHSEVVWVPANLAARVPDGVSLESAAFSTLGAIALHGVRQADARLGEWVAVVGLGLLGQLTVRLLRAGGMRVVGIDLDPARVALAETAGAAGIMPGERAGDRVAELTGGVGVDATILTATSQSPEPIELAARIARDRGRIVVVGQVPLEASRVLFLEKELELRVSRSYGPGRYDAIYEEKGVDYPIGYVRWTEGRNLAAFLDLLRDGTIDVGPLISHRFPITAAETAYELVMGGRDRAEGRAPDQPETRPSQVPGASGDEADRSEQGRLAAEQVPGASGEEADRADQEPLAVEQGTAASGDEADRAEQERLAAEQGTATSAGPLGVVLTYPPGRSEPSAESRRIETTTARSTPSSSRTRGARPGRLRIGLVGAGSFARSTVLPIMSKLPVELVGVSSAGGTSALATAEAHGFRYIAASAEELCEDPEIDAVLIATRHGDHARLAERSLRAGKATFVEKPLALDEDGLDRVLEAARETALPFTVGFNRRFSAAARFLREGLDELPGARVVHIRVNAGAAPPDHWVHDPEEGGGRWVGEGCHFVDLALYLTGSLPETVHAVRLAGDDPHAVLCDNLQVTLSMQDGSLASILYTAKGNLRSGKERVEVFAGGVTGELDDFRRASLVGRTGRRWRGRPDKGHAAELTAFVGHALKSEPPPIPLTEIEASSRATLRVLRSLAEGRPQPVR